MQLRKTANQYEKSCLTRLLFFRKKEWEALKIIAIGTTNQAKVAAVRSVFSSEHYTLVPTDVPSDVSVQPLSDHETRQGAINRAKHALQKENADIGIGLEGGVMEIDGELWLCNWGALADRDGTVITAGGARIPLPFEVAKGIRAGRELGDVMAEYTGERNIRHKEGAIGVFTNGYVDRAGMFRHIVQLLVGQYEFFCQNH
jgi:inosine/xanthosine triphosphatase